LSFEFYKESYAGAIKAISIGKGKKAVTVGGETCYPLYQFEGAMPHKPKVAMEIWDMAPDEWPAAALEPFKDVVSDPAAWAKKCVKEYGAEIIVLQLKSTDPNGTNASPADASATVKKVLAAIDVPLVVWGVANHEKDEAVFKQIAQDCQDVQLTLGPVEDKNHKGIGAAAMGYGHAIISSSPIDVNLAKQVNILLENLGMPMDRVIIDPTTGGLGYGLEYSYSVMERLRMAAMAQGDDKLQMPIINNLANEIWKCKEAKQGVEEAPTLGDPEKRGILMETVGAVTYLMAGSDILIMRHPEAIRLVKAFIDIAMDGGSAADIAPIAKRLEGVSVDLAALAPAPDLAIVEEKKAAPAKVAAAPKAEAKPAAAPKAAAKPAAAPAAAKKAEPAAVAAPAAPAVDAEAAAKAKAEAEAAIQAKAAADAKAKVDADVKAKADAEARVKAEAEAKVKAEKAAAAKAAADREAGEEALRQKRAAERAKMAAERGTGKVDNVVPMTPAAEQKSEPEKILERLKWVHRRVSLY
jgi:acetyl-CoA decarbonylase/synthase complex subunit delta